MIELQMVKRMIIKGIALAPFLAAILFVWNGAEWALSGIVGLAMTLLNLLLAARVIGGVVENNPRLLLPAAMVAFTLGLAVLTGIAFALKASDIVYFPVTGLVLVGSHLLLVAWEAAATYRIDPKKSRLQTQKT